MRGALFVPVAISEVAFCGSNGGKVAMSVVPTGMVIDLAYTGRRRRWKKSYVALGTIFVFFGGIMVYSMFVNVEEAQATNPVSGERWEIGDCP